VYPAQSGEVHQEVVKITVIDYDNENYEEKDIKDVRDCFEYSDRPTVTWINIDSTDDAQVIKTLGRYFNLHPLLQEDIRQSNQRPKVDFYEHNIFLLTKMLTFNTHLKKIEVEQISFVLGNSYLLTFQEGIEGDVFDRIRVQLRGKGRGKLRFSGESYLFYVLLDTMVATYVEVLESIHEELETIEDKIINDIPITDTTKILYELKQQFLIIRKIARPLQDVVTQLIREEAKFLNSSNLYMRDLYERVVQLGDAVDSSIEICANLLDLHLNLLSKKTNDVMKILTILSAIFLPLTFIAGVYGMNFEFMPELRYKTGYFRTLGVMAVIAMVLLGWFRWKKWV
jgi:magnesium transporter